MFMKKQISFKSLKNELLVRIAKKTVNAACCYFFNAVDSSRNKGELLSAIAEYWTEALSEGMIDAKYLETNFSEKELSNVNIFTKGVHIVRKNAFACGTATVKVWGTATVRAFGEATVLAGGKSSIFAFDNVTVHAYGESQTTALGTSVVRAFDDAYVHAVVCSTVFAYDRSRVFAQHCSTVYATGKAKVEVYNYATAKVTKDVDVYSEGNCLIQAWGCPSVKANEPVVVNEYGGDVKYGLGYYLDR